MDKMSDCKYLTSYEGERGNLKISPTKAQLMRKSVKFLGQIISEEELRVDPKRTEAILKLKEPTSVKHLQKFPGKRSLNGMRNAKGHSIT